MSQLVMMVLNDPEQLDTMLEAWTQAGATGITVMQSTGMRKFQDRLHRDDLPLFPSLRDLLEQEQIAHCTLFTVVFDDAVVDRLIAATRRVVGDLDEDNTGILFTLPVGRVIGIRR